MTLVEFLLARLAEDEAAAQRAVPGPWELQGEPRETLVFSAPTGVSVAVGWLRDLDHVARHDPARVLAEVAAKRLILEYAPPKAHGTFDDGWRRGQMAFHAHTLRLLALPYAGHPDYREEWKP